MSGWSRPQSPLLLFLPLPLALFLLLACGGCAARDDGASEAPGADADILAPALLVGETAAALEVLQAELRNRLSQPRLLLRKDAFRTFHRITLSPAQPPAATDRLRKPLPQVELLTDGDRCWLRLPDGDSWPVDGVGCRPSPGAPGENTSYTN